ncbi:MAG: class I SAM-dependent methyltransferase [Candidatus Hydrogenedentota bacterium]
MNHVDIASFFTSDEILSMFLFLNNFYLNKTKEFAINNNISEVDIFGYSITGRLMHHYLNLNNVKVIKIFDNNLKGTMVNGLNISDIDKISDGTERIMIICSSISREKLESIHNKFKSAGYKVFFISDILKEDDSLLFTTLFTRLPLAIQTIIYENHNKNFWEIFGTTWYEKIRYSGKNGVISETRNRYFREFISDKLSVPDCNSFCEIGIGTGDNIVILQKNKNVQLIVGVDISCLMLKKVRNKYGIPVINVDLRHGLSFKNKVFDVVFTSSVIQHISQKYLSIAIDELIRISKKYIFHFEGVHKNSPMTTEVDLKKLYEAKGYGIEEYDFYAEYPQIESYKTVELQCIRINL